MLKTQVEIFNLIAQRFKTKVAMYTDIASFTNVKPEAVEKWASGKVPLVHNRLQLLESRYELQTLDLNKLSEDEAIVKIKTIEMDGLSGCCDVLHEFAAKLRELFVLDQAQICFMCDEIPIFHFIPYRRLAYFRLFCNYYNRRRADGGEVIQFEIFEEEMRKRNMNQVLDEIQASYESMDREEIWGEGVLDYLLYQIEEACYLDLFGHTESKRAILEELNIAVDRFFDKVSNPENYHEGRFNFLKRPFSKGGSFMFFNDSDTQKMVITFNAINNIETSNVRLMKEYKKEYELAKKNTTALGVGDECQRMKFKSRLSEKIKRTILEA